MNSNAGANIKIRITPITEPKQNMSQETPAIAPMKIKTIPHKIWNIFIGSSLIALLQTGPLPPFMCEMDVQCFWTQVDFVVNT